MLENVSAAPKRSQSYWMMRRQIFFVQQRLFYLISACLPDNKIGGQFRASLLRMMGAKVGAGCTVRSGLIVQEWFGSIQLGDNVWINANCCLDGSMDIVIGDNVIISFQVTFITGGHEFGDHNKRAGKSIPKPVHIGAGTWIGARSVILPGVSIGEGCIVGAAAVVTKSFGQDLLLVGFPAKVRKEIGETSDSETDATRDQTGNHDRN